ncbi:MAG: glycine C-acetyltransferase [Actinomycetota bacterium]|nr:glycine C-acetyltransferase [Actinomycetota bacterium]
MYGTVRSSLRAEIDSIAAEGLYKRERVLESPQQARVIVSGDEVLNFCANNYLGLADDSRIVAAAKEGLERYGYGMASVRFICGTETVHTRLEERLSSFLRTEATVLYSSCFDANGGLFETLLGEEDAVISDALNHASIIDGIRLCRAERLRYANRDMADLEAQLVAASGARRRLIATDGVFSMDGYVAPLDRICELAERYDALVMVDDSHAVGVVGEAGRGTPALHGVEDRVDVVTGTLGKALGGASGGYVSGRGEIAELLRQRSRPYLFSNSLAPSIAAASLVALDLIESSDDLRERLMENTAYFRSEMIAARFEVLPGDHPIVPVIVGDAALATNMADALLERGVYVVGFSFPVVPRGAARIRVQISAAHARGDLEQAVAAFKEVRDLLLIGRRSGIGGARSTP